MKEEFIKLYDQYMIDSKEERMIELTDLEKEGKKKVELKGDLEGFMEWIRKSL